MDDNVDFSTEGLDLTSLDFSGFEAQGNNVQAEDQPEDVETGSAPSGNPAWNEYIEKVPEGLRDIVTPHLTPAFEAWDKKVQERFNEINQQWDPWKRFQERKIDPEYLDKAYGVAQRLQEDPVGLYQALHQYFQQSPEHLQQLQQLGLIPAEVQQAQADGNLEAEDPIATLQQEIQQLKQERLQEMQEARIAEEFNQEYERTLSAIDADFEAIEQQAGRPLPNNIRAEIIKQAQFMGQQQQRYVSVVEAAPHVFRFIQQARAGIKSPPRPVGSGSIPQSTQFDPATATDEERYARIAQIAQQYADN